MWSDVSRLESTLSEDMKSLISRTVSSSERGVKRPERISSKRGAREGTRRLLSLMKCGLISLRPVPIPLRDRRKALFLQVRA